MESPWHSDALFQRTQSAMHMVAAVVLGRHCGLRMQSKLVD